MGWFGIGKEVKEVGEGVSSITAGVRHLFTGDIPPEIIKELDKIDKEHTTARWQSDNLIPFWKSSRSIVLLLLTLNWVTMTWFNTGVAEYWVDANMSLMLLVTGAFFGSKGVELMKGVKV